MCKEDWANARTAYCALLPGDFDRFPPVPRILICTAVIPTAINRFLIYGVTDVEINLL